MRRLRIRLSTAVIGLLAMPALAQSPNFGVQAILSTPSAGLQDRASSGGYGGALTFDWPLAGGHVLRPRIDYVEYRDKATTTTSISSSSSTTIHSLYSVKSTGFGLDYLFYPSGEPKGWHVDVGVEEMRYAIKVSGTVTFSSVTTSTTAFTGPDTSSSKLGYGLGTGYDFARHWSLGLRFTSTKIGSLKFDAFNTSIGYRF